MKIGKWVVMGTSTTHVVCGHQMRIFHISFAYLFWLANNKKLSIQSSVWSTLMKLGMWVVMGTSTTHVVCRHQMRIFNTSFAHLFWLANNKKLNIQSSVWATLMKPGMWVVMGTSTTYVVYRHQMRIFNISFAHLFWLANNKKLNIQSSVWATLMKLGMWVVMGTSTTHVVCCHQMCIFNTSFAYLF